MGLEFRDAGGSIDRMKEELARIAGNLEKLAETERLRPPNYNLEEFDAALVRRVIRARRMRSTVFKGDLFADPAWDMMLDLFAARLEGYRVAVSSACIAAAVPATTALRWIKALIDRGIFVRSVDPMDARRAYLELSEEAAEGMESYFRMLQADTPVV